ncbi:hypothetical protein D9615_001065 [Tricholomella constricta]|uniref:Carbohydrate esterase family 16 protein n=1 Tax=Tricholomella constricta TaxID=117010 RepID=A0A8H5M8X6_9AGAR|nr:hypothetical protein D9615_001065 [Tricholomella constricta]
MHDSWDFKMRLSTSFLLAAFSLTSAAVLRRETTTPDVHLAVQPRCGSLSGAVADVNAGLRPLNTYKTIVSFGDAYSDGGVQDGSSLKPPVMNYPDPKAGGRMSNGPIWVENLAKSVGATLKDYAASGAVVDSSQYPGTNLDRVNDFSAQANLFIGQGVKYDPDTTLYTVFFGINDFEEGGDLNMVAQNIAYRLVVLSSSPAFARNVLVVDNYGRGTNTSAGEAFKQQVFSALKSLHTLLGMNIGYVDLSM